MCELTSNQLCMHYCPLHLATQHVSSCELQLATTAATKKTSQGLSSTHKAHSWPCSLEEGWTARPDRRTLASSAAALLVWLQRAFPAQAPHG